MADYLASALEDQIAYSEGNDGYEGWDALPPVARETYFRLADELLEGLVKYEDEGCDCGCSQYCVYRGE